MSNSFFQHCYLNHSASHYAGGYSDVPSFMDCYWIPSGFFSDLFPISILARILVLQHLCHPDCLESSSDLKLYPVSNKNTDPVFLQNPVNTFFLFETKLSVCTYCCLNTISQSILHSFRVCFMECGWQYAAIAIFLFQAVRYELKRFRFQIPREFAQLISWCKSG